MKKIRYVSNVIALSDLQGSKINLLPVLGLWANSMSQLVMFLARLGPAFPALAWPEAALAYSNLRPGFAVMALAWPGLALA